MKNYLLLFTILAFISFVQGQNKADDYYEAGYFKEASLIYKKELNTRKGPTEAVQLKLADCYFQMNEYNNSLKIYENLFKNDNRDSITIIRIAELNRMFCKYDEAKEYYSFYKEKYISNQGDKLKFDKAITSKVNYPKTNKSIDNSILINELTLPQVQKGMGYTSLENGDILGGITQIDKKTKTSFTTLGKFSYSSGFQSVEEFKLNEKTPFFNAYPSYNKANKTLYFTANSNKKKKSFKNDDNVLQIYSLNLESEDNEPELLKFNSAKYNFTHPSISKDGKKLYFVSDKPGGYGGYDVYYVEKTIEGWSEVKNCGENINTQFDELTPFITGDSLYFSSYGHQNYGGSDIFLSSVKDGGYSKATNLGLPINSCMNDFSFIMSPDSGNGILTSDRNYETSKKDAVYQVEFPITINKITDERTNSPIAEVVISINEGDGLLSNNEGEWSKRIPTGSKATIKFDNPYYETKILEFSSVTNSDLEEIENVKLAPILLSGSVKDDITGNPLSDVSVTLYEKVGEDDWKIVETKKTDKKGDWEFHIRKDKEYKVDLEKNNYISHNEIVPRHNDPSELRNDVLSRINPFSMKYEAVKDLVIQIDNIYFDFNSSYIQKESFNVLEKVKDFLNDNPEIKIELSAHTDCMGKDSYNLWLSNKRAESSKKYLVDAGISANRIIAKGYGEQRMIVLDCELQKRDDSEAQKNRRVEVKIL